MPTLKEMEVLLGHLNPMDATDDEGVSGVQARLASLGYYHGTVDGELGPKTRNAIRCFQSEHNLTVDGEISDDLRSALSDEHGC